MTTPEELEALARMNWLRLITAFAPAAASQLIPHPPLRSSE